MRIITALLLTLTLILLTSTAIARDYSDYRVECDAIRRQVEQILESENVSLDYFYLLVAESHCKGEAVSKAGAVGYWQMMPATAKSYGCDDPFNLECETRAAAKYLKHLEAKCGKNDVILCWHDGGSNFLRKGRKATNPAKGLRHQFRLLLKSDK